MEEMWAFVSSLQGHNLLSVCMRVEGVQANRKPEEFAKLELLRETLRPGSPLPCSTRLGAPPPIHVRGTLSWGSLLLWAA